jgi:hypothetical protein
MNTTQHHTTPLTRDQIVANDTRLAEIYVARNEAVERISSIVRHLNFAMNVRSNDPQMSLADLRWSFGTGDMPKRIYGIDTAEQFAEIDAQQEIIADLDAEATPLNEAFYAQRWSRFFLVTNTDGHIHSSMGCSTCHHTTQFAWLPLLSDQTEAEAVAEHGGILCTVCYPSAPTEWTDQPSHAKRAAMDERAAAKAARDAKKLEKALRPDGSTITLIGTEQVNGRGQTYTRKTQITTLAQAKTWLREISDVRAEGRYLADSYIAQSNCWTVDNEATITFAIAAKTGTTASAVRDEFTAKAEKKAAKYR